MKFTSTLLASLIAVTSVSAHATWQEFWVGSTDEAGSNVRLPVSNSPVTSVTSNDIACNANAGSSPGKISVAAGSSVTVEMHQQVCTHYALRIVLNWSLWRSLETGETLLGRAFFLLTYWRTCSTEAIGGNHYGTREVSRYLERHWITP